MAYKIMGEVYVEKGLGLPRLTTAQRTAYVPSAEGFEVWDTDLKEIYVWDGTVWVPAGNAPVDSVNGQTGVVVLTGSDITITPVGDLTSTDVQAALAELQGDIDALEAIGAADYIAGSGAPTAGDGVDGNYYLDVTTGDIYGPKAAGVWPGTTVGNAYTNQLATVAPPAVGAGTVGTSQLAAREDHTHDVSLDNLQDVDVTTTAPVADDILVFDGTNWVPGQQSAESYDATFTVGDWTGTDPLTLTIPAGTHGLTPQTIYDVTVKEGTTIVEVCTGIDASGNVTLETRGAAFGGEVKISI